MTLSAAAFLALALITQRELRHEHRYVPDQYIALAIAEHESDLDPRVCKNETDGSSSRGLMQLNHKGVSCASSEYDAEYEPATNIRKGMRLLSLQYEYHQKHCRHPHDVLTHFAGSGPIAVRFATWVRRRARKLRKEMKQHG